LIQTGFEHSLHLLGCCSIPCAGGLEIPIQVIVKKYSPQNRCPV